MWSSLLLAAAVSVFSIILLIYARRHKAGLPVPAWTIRYGAALAFVGLAAVMLFSSYLRVNDPDAIGQMTLETPFFWLALFSMMPATALGSAAVHTWARQTMPTRRWLNLLLIIALGILAIGGYSLAHRAIYQRHDAIERYSHRGYDLLEAKRYAEAIPEYERALALDPTNAYYHLQLGIAQCNVGRYAESERNLKTAIENERKYNLGYVVYRAEATRYLYRIAGIRLLNEGIDQPLPAEAPQSAD